MHDPSRRLVNGVSLLALRESWDEPSPRSTCLDDVSLPSPVSSPDSLLATLASWQLGLQRHLVKNDSTDDYDNLGSRGLMLGPKRWSLNLSGANPQRTLAVLGCRPRTPCRCCDAKRAGHCPISLPRHLWSFLATTYP